METNELHARLQHAVETTGGQGNQIPASSSVPLNGEIVFNSDRTNFKVGDGVIDPNTGQPTGTAYSSLPDIIPSAPGTLNTNNSTAQTVSNSEALSGNINLHKVSKTGNYNDLLNKPTIPSAPVQSDWNQTDSSQLDYIKNKPDWFPSYVSLCENTSNDPQTLEDIISTFVASTSNTNQRSFIINGTSEFEQISSLWKNIGSIEPNYFDNTVSSETSIIPYFYIDFTTNNTEVIEQLLYEHQGEYFEFVINIKRHANFSPYLFLAHISDVAQQECAIRSDFEIVTPQYLNGILDTSIGPSGNTIPGIRIPFELNTYYNNASIRLKMARFNNKTIIMIF